MQTVVFRVDINERKQFFSPGVFIAVLLSMQEKISLITI